MQMGNTILWNRKIWNKISTRGYYSLFYKEWKNGGNEHELVESTHFNCVSGWVDSKAVFQFASSNLKYTNVVVLKLKYANRMIELKFLKQSILWMGGGRLVKIRDNVGYCLLLFKQFLMRASCLPNFLVYSILMSLTSFLKVFSIFSLSASCFPNFCMHSSLASCTSFLNMFSLFSISPSLDWTSSSRNWISLSLLPSWESRLWHA